MKIKIMILMVICSTVLFRVAFSAEVLPVNKKSSQVKVVPGSSLGEVSIGNMRSDLIAKGYAPDKFRDPAAYLEKDLILAHFVDNRVSQIWYNGDTKNLVLRGKKFPRQSDSKTLTKFFKGCEPKVEGSGGVLFYCENRGIELAYSFSDKFQGISVVTPAVVEQVVGPKK